MSLPTNDELRGAVAARLPEHRVELERLIGIPSVSAPGFDPALVRASAEAVATLLERTGLAGSRLLEVPHDGGRGPALGEAAGAHPAAFAELRVAADAPTVLLYAHHDVQPPGDESAWTSPPFVATERDGRLYGRGASDDKAGILTHVAAVAAWRDVAGAPPVNVKVLIEGEEEIGSGHLPLFLERYASELAADVAVVMDASNAAVGVPGRTISLRGLVDCIVEVRALDAAQHSGVFGGAVPDALMGLLRLLSGLVDEHGSIAVPALRAGVVAPPVALPPDDPDGLRVEAGMRPGVGWVGDPATPINQRLWYEPNLTVIGIDAPPIAGSANALVPVARARVSLRIAPAQDPAVILDALCAHLRASAPWGLEITVTPGAAGRGFSSAGDHPAHAAADRALTAGFGTPPVLLGLGGTIPLVEPLLEAFGPGSAALLLGVGDPAARIHSIDESQHLGDWEKACVADAVLLRELGS